jgi:hypothetical protein
MGINPSWFNGVRIDWPEPGTNTDFGINLNRPVETLTWFDATNFCANLTERERSLGQIPAGGGLSAAHGGRMGIRMSGMDFHSL